MSKVMLILDRPRYCTDCILMNDRNICIAVGLNVLGMEAELCPLVELPYFLTETEVDFIDAMINHGWNACIRKILGDEDETD